MDFYKVNKDMVGRMVDMFVGLVELLLTLRVIVQFFFTTAGGGFVHWVLSTTDVLLTPFRAVFTGGAVAPGNWYVDWVALFAMAVYMAAGYILLGVAGRWGRK